MQDGKAPVKDAETNAPGADLEGESNDSKPKASVSPSSKKDCSPGNATISNNDDGKNAKKSTPLVREAVRRNWSRFLNQDLEASNGRMFHPREEGALTILSSNLGKHEVEFLIEKVTQLPPDKRPQRLHLQLNQNLGSARVARLVEFLNLCQVFDMILFFYTLVPTTLMQNLKHVKSLKTLEFNGGHGAFPGLGGFQAGPHLESLCLSGLRVTHVQLHEIITSLQTAKALQHFKLEFCRVYSDNMFFMARLVEEHKSLDFIEVAGLNMERNLPLEESSLLKESLLRHKAIRKISLSVDQSQIELIAPLANDFSKCSSLQSIRFRNPFFDGEKAGESLKLTIQNSAIQVDRFMRAMSEIEGISHLHIDGILNPRHTKSMLQKSSCKITKLTMEQELDGEELFQLCSGLKEYPHLVKCSLKLGTVTSFETFFPSSTLLEVNLAFWNPGSPPFEILATVLREQKQLVSLKAEVLDVIAFKPEDKFKEFANQLEIHPSLVNFYFGWTSIVFIGLEKPGIKRWLPDLFPAVAKNKVLRRLDLSELDLDLDMLVDAIPTFQTLESLYLPRDRIQGFDRLLEALRKNGSIMRVESDEPAPTLRERELNHAPANPAPFFRDRPGFSAVLRRNRLIRHSHSIAEKRDRLPPGVLPNILAQLGSNHAEPSPIFEFLKAGSSAVFGFVSRKRKALKDGNGVI